jgi:hypothetical protein
MSDCSSLETEGRLRPSLLLRFLKVVIFMEFRIRNLSKTTTANDGTRNLFQSILVPEVALALKDWIKVEGLHGVLIGGLALSYYVKPRVTQDIDILFLDRTHIPDIIPGFKRHRPGAFEHKRTGVEIEVLSPASINMPLNVAKRIEATALNLDGIRIASPSGLVASKLGRFSRRDQADIEDLLHVKTINLDGFGLSSQQLDKFELIKSDMGM